MSDSTTSTPERRRPADGPAPDEPVLSWSEVLALAPALGRLVLLTGQRLLVGTVDSATSTTRSVVALVVDPAAPSTLLAQGRGRLVELAREALGIAEMDAVLRRLAGEDPADPVPPPDLTADLEDVTGDPADASATWADATARPPSTGEPDAPDPTATEDPAADDTAAGDTTADDTTHDPAADTGREPAEEPGPPHAPAAGPAPGVEPERPELRERARLLLAQSATLEDDEQHPAFGVLLDELAPDEMRILRVFARDGDQPVVDVESRGPLGGRGRLVAERLSLLSEVAGCKHPDRLPVYLDNLERLRLVRVVGEPLDGSDYEVIEAQEAATSARDSGSRAARFLRRRLTLSAFGAAFCRCCLPL